MTTSIRLAFRAASRLLPVALAVVVVHAAPARSAVVCTAAALCGSGTAPCTIAGTHDVSHGCHLDFGSRVITLTGTLQSPTTASSFAITAGSFTIDNGKLKSVGSPSESGGDIDVTVSGLFRMDGALARIDTGAIGGGGAVTITAGTVQLANGKIIANGGGIESCGDGGGVTISATGSVLLDGTIDSTAGAACGGGTISISGTAIDVLEPINVSGGDAGFAEIELTATGGAVTTQAAGALRANGSPVSVDTGGNGGTILLSASGAVTLNAVVEATGAAVDGSGGTIEIVAGGDVSANEVLNVDGLGGFSYGGAIAIESGAQVILGKDVRARSGGSSAGGSIAIEASGDVQRTSGGSILADGGALGGGIIEIAGHESGVFEGPLRARGSGGGDGGIIAVETCTVDVRSALDVTPAGAAMPGEISLRGGSVSVGATGAMLATGCPTGSPCNTIDVRIGLPTLNPLAVLSPSPAIAVDPAIDTCCGNSSLDFGETCDDGNALSCDGCSRTCIAEASPPCPADGNACTNDCSPTAGCVYAPLTGPACASDGNACTNDVCTAGACTHPTANCSDGVACTVDSCQPSTGCASVPNHALCADGTTCTTETCNAAIGCEYVNEADGSPCDDADACTSEDACEDGACEGQGALDCDDGDSCTTDTCNAAFGCLNADDPAACPCTISGTPLPAGTRCADGDTCTGGEECDGTGACVGGGSLCDDGDPCTQDSCIARLFCNHMDNLCPSQCGTAADGTPCSDGSACTTGACQGGTCASAPIACNDGDPCNGTEACTGNLGCRQVSWGELSCSATVDALLCYRSSIARGAAKFLPVRDLSVEDAFGSRLVDLKRVRDLCMPADVNGSDPDAPEHDDVLTSYLARESSSEMPAPPVRGLVVGTAYGSLTIDLGPAERVRVPTSLDTGAPPTAPIPPDPDDFKCYQARLSIGSAAPPAPTAVPVTDGFGPLVIDVRRPTQFCVPASLDGQNPQAPSHPEGLLCFQARTSKGHPSFSRRTGLFTHNSLGETRLDALRLSEICVPATLPAS
jgi:cysteine-rich repeat protein